uniref:Uncharacterized protein n=1 Tax=Rhipicephalus microplus TaxID=6941 RepID=A0A6G5AIA5_RHIMP
MRTISLLLSKGMSNNVTCMPFICCGETCCIDNDALLGYMLSGEYLESVIPNVLPSVNQSFQVEIRASKCKFDSACTRLRSWQGSLIEKVQNRLHSTGSHVANSFRAVYLNLYWQKVPRLSLKQKRQIMWSNLVHFFAEVCQVCCCSKLCFIVIHIVVVVFWSNCRQKKKMTVK